MRKKTKVTKAIQLSDLDCFIDNGKRYAHSLSKHVIYTPGIKYLAENANAYWLLDAITSYYGTKIMKAAIAKDQRLSSLHFWTR